MSNFKIGDRIKILNGCNVGREGVVVNLHEYFVEVSIYKDNLIVPNLAYGVNELELIKMQEKKTKTVKKYAVVGVNGKDTVVVKSKFTQQEFEELGSSPFATGWKYHIVPTLFIEEKVPVETETRYTFICEGGKDNYYPTDCKYKDLETAKLHTMNQAIQQIDSSAEEFEIE